MKFCCEPMLSALKCGLMRVRALPIDGGFPLDGWEVRIRSNTDFRTPVSYCPFCGKPVTIKTEKTFKDFGIGVDE